MDDFLNNILSSSSWPDNENGAGRSSWVGSTSAQTNGLLTNPIGVYERDEKTTSSPLNIIPSGPIIGHMVHEDPPVFVGGNSNYSLNKMLFPNKAQPQDLDHVSALPPQLDNGSQKGNLLLQGMIQTSPKSQSSALLPQRSSQLLSTVGVSASPLWSASYGGVSSLPPALAQGKLQGFGLQGEFVESGADILGKRYIGDDKLPQLDNLPVSSLNEQNELHNPHYRPFTAVPPLTSPRTTGLQPHQQLSQSSEANSIQHYTNQSSVSQPVLAAGGSCNGTAKPRVRARRGQATDPHSIAERLRREKIAERMKNLQELVPNSNKTDKASMLDEIIEYVKFLQLQVKVLSMSRLGAAGAVVPLITDVQSEGSAGLLLSASIGQGPDLSESPENIAFEQEVVKLMESNVTTAIQYLQTKGLCLMPIALAAAISNGKASSNIERMNLSTTQGPISPNSGPACSGTSNKSITKDNATTINCCNGSVVKQEEVQRSASIKESTPKA